MIEEQETALAATQDQAETLFDEYGRLIPPADLGGVNIWTRRYYTLVQAVQNYEETHGLIKEHLGIKNPISLAEFEDRALAILERLRGDAQTKHRERLPWILAVKPTST